MNRFLGFSSWAGLLLVLVAVTGCGVKDLPRLPAAEPATLTGLAAEQEGDRIVLRWSLSGSDAVPAAFRIYRSQPPPCEGCPRPFQRIDDVGYADAAEGDGFRYVDDPPPGMESVRYRVIPIGPGGAETGAGGLVEIDLGSDETKNGNSSP
ncbi:MAG: hypothetical protein ACOC98_02840 [Thermodesulfobacteriota bacterium]